MLLYVCMRVVVRSDTGSGASAAGYNADAHGRDVLLPQEVINQHFSVKAKFHYASWFGVGSEPVRS